MATKKHTRAAFTAKLLAPLPADVEQVDNEAFRKTLQMDERRATKASYNALYDVWHHRQCVLKLETHRKDVKLYSWIVAGRPAGGPRDNDELASLHAAKRALMLTRAPGKTQLSWKLAELKWYADDAEVVAAIAADTARIAPKQEA
ncbi:MAG: hypothetical protein EON59_06565 [Alphaproteobacteria bacterium]|nr:MAG: hypothetical protein EON59_06565 [Alphaproteobacteria bacterium]